MIVQTPASRNVEFRPNHRRAQITVIALGVCVLISMLISIVSLTALELYQRWASGNFTLSEVTTLGERLSTLGLFESGAYLVTATIFLFWVYRAYQNHEQLARRGAQYSPNWAVLGFLVPIISLFRPYQVMGEMWDETQIDEQTDPYRAAPSRTIVIVWWISFLAMNYLSRLSALAASDADSAASLTSATLIDLLVQALTILSAILAIRIIQKIDIQHETRLREVRPFDTLTDRPSWTPIVYTWSIGLSAIILGIVLFSPVQIPPAPNKSANVAPTATSRQVGSGSSVGRKPIATTPPKRSSGFSTADHIRRGRQFLESDNSFLAVSEFSQALNDDPENAELFYLRGIANLNLENYDGALRDFTKAIELDDQYVEAYYERGMTHVDMKDYGLARKDFDQALKIDPKYVDAYVGRGWTHYLREEYTDALKDVNQALKLDDQVVDAYHVRGLVYLDTGKFELSIADFSQAIKLEPDSAPAFYRRGLAYHANGDLELSLKDFNQALKIRPNYLDAYYGRGRVNYDRGDYQAALVDFGKVIDRYPTYGLVYLERGITYASLQDYDKAITDVEKALSLELSATDRADAEKLLENLKAKRKGNAS